MRRSATATSCFPSAPALMTGSRGKLHEFAPHAQIVHIDIDTASISGISMWIFPIVADAREALTKMTAYVGGMPYETLALTDRCVEKKNILSPCAPMQF